MKRSDDIAEVIEVFYLDQDGTHLGVQQEQRAISRAAFLIRELNRIGKKEAVDVRQVWCADPTDLSGSEGTGR
jgi:hypothetical protein